MVNFQVVKETIDALKIDVNAEMVPSAVPVIEVGMKKTKNGISKVGNRTSSGAGAIYTAINNQDFFITGVIFGLVKDATCDLATSAPAITATQDGVTINLICIPSLTLTAQNSIVSVDLSTHPIKIDRNTAINFSASTFTAGTMIRAATIYGYYDECN